MKKTLVRASAVAFVTVLLLLLLPVRMPGCVTAQAAVKISARSKTLVKGKTYTLKITGTKKKVTWSTSRKSVATVNSKGKVTAVKQGKATITAKVGGKSYTCRITVVPFSRTKETLNKAVSFYRPKGWVYEGKDEPEDSLTKYLYAPTQESASGIVVTVTSTKMLASDVTKLGKKLASYYKSLYEKQKVNVDEISYDKVTTGEGDAVHVKVLREGDQLDVYLICKYHYLVEVDAMTRDGEKAKPSVKSAVAYLLSTLEIKE